MSKKATHGILYVVATPIGNFEDITLRALRVLKEVDLILCEDTRITRNLLRHFDIKNKTQSYHAHSSLRRENEILKMLQGGKKLALVSDAGTPCVSDPGQKLIAKIIKEIGQEVTISPIPGSNALISTISVAGISAAQFVFLGFLPQKKGRERIFEYISNAQVTIAFYESPHRIIKTLGRLHDYLTNKRTVIVGRELTKIYEEIVRGTPKEVYEYFTDNREKERGEFVVLISPEK